MSVISDMRTGIMALIDAETGWTSIPWDGDPLAFKPDDREIGVQWMSGVDSETEEISSEGVFPQVEHFLVLVPTQDSSARWASDQAFELMEAISSALNESPIAVSGQSNAAVCRPYRNPDMNGNTKQCLPGHGGKALYLMAFKVERFVE